MLRTVLLRHQLPDGSWHFDWMLELPPTLPTAASDTPDDPEARRLMTFQAGIRPDDPTCAAFQAVRLPDHRLRYLTFEGDLSDDRGRVTRVASGTYTVLARTADGLDIILRLPAESPERRISGRAQPCNIWNFSLRP